MYFASALAGGRVTSLAELNTRLVLIVVVVLIITLKQILCILNFQMKDFLRKGLQPNIKTRADELSPDWSR